jgi:hypothetical protein
MRVNNPVLKAAGYAPVSDVMKALGVQRSTVHRMIEANPQIKTIRDGGGAEVQALYVLIASLRDFYNKAGNPPMADKLEELRKRYAKEFKAA